MGVRRRAVHVVSADAIPSVPSNRGRRRRREALWRAVSSDRTPKRFAPRSPNAGWPILLIGLALALPGRVVSPAPGDAAAEQPQLVVCLGHTSPVRELAWSPDGKTLATASYDEEFVPAWDPDREPARSNDSV